MASLSSSSSVSVEENPKPTPPSLRKRAGADNRDDEEAEDGDRKAPEIKPTKRRRTSSSSTAKVAKSLCEFCLGTADEKDPRWVKCHNCEESGYCPVHSYRDTPRGKLCQICYDGDGEDDDIGEPERCFCCTAAVARSQGLRLLTAPVQVQEIWCSTECFRLLRTKDIKAIALNIDNGSDDDEDEDE
jgi:hypothetical protein